MDTTEIFLAGTAITLGAAVVRLAFRNKGAFRRLERLLFKIYTAFTLLSVGFFLGTLFGTTQVTIRHAIDFTVFYFSFAAFVILADYLAAEH